MKTEDSKTPYTFDRVVRILIGVGVTTVIFLVLKYLSPVLLPFIIGWLIAYLLHPFVEFFQHKLKFKYRLPSILTTLILFFGSITGIIILLIPMISSEISKVSDMIVYFTQNFDMMGVIPDAWEDSLTHYIQRIDLEATLNNPNFQDFLKNIAPKLWGYLNNSINFIFGLVVLIIVFIYMFFILLDYDKINNDWVNIIPVKYRSIVREIYNDLVNSMNRYFRGQALIALIVGILFSIGFYLIDLPLAIVFGIFVGMLNLVPYLQTISFIPAFFLILLKMQETGASFGSVFLGVIIVYIVVQSIQDLILVPKIMGKVTGLNPAVILLSLSIWGYMMGILGMIIALPMTTLIISYYKRWVLKE